MRSYRSLLRTAAGLDPRARGSPEWLARRRPRRGARGRASRHGPGPRGPARGPANARGEPATNATLRWPPRGGRYADESRGPPASGPSPSIPVLGGGAPTGIEADGPLAEGL